MFHSQLNVIGGTPFGRLMPCPLQGQVRTCRYIDTGLKKYLGTSKKWIPSQPAKLTETLEREGIKLIEEGVEH